MDTVVPVECSEVVMVVTEMATVLAGAWSKVALIEEIGVTLGDSLDL